ncbi:hypothetical protein P7C73_g2528, partial [Tremellales sp. Uapishka_1]
MQSAASHINAIAGPSRHTQHGILSASPGTVARDRVAVEGSGVGRVTESGGSHDSVWSSEDGEGGGSSSRKKRKITRSRNACYPCRARKCRCGGSPPDPCASCVKDQLPCSWPTADGRSAEARKERTKTIIQLEASREAAKGPEVHEWNWMMDSDWLDTLDRATTSYITHAPSGAPSSDFRMDVSSTDIPPSIEHLLGSMKPTWSDMGHESTTSDHTLPLFDTSNAPRPHNATDPYGLAPTPAWLTGLYASDADMPTTPQFSTAVDENVINGVMPMNVLSTAESATILSFASSKQTEREKQREDTIVKVTWWRPHGQTAIAPGLKRIILKVKVDHPTVQSHGDTPQSASGFGDISEELASADRMPSASIMRHLLHLFLEHFGSQFPFITRQSLESATDARTGSVFLFHCIAGMAARFSTHPAIAKPDLIPSDYGKEFYGNAKEMLGSMFTVPSRETVIGLCLMAHLGLANDSESEVWMFTGMAVRMTIDLGLHLDPPLDSDIPAEDRRRNRLVFWSVLLLDFALAFGTGRQTTLRVEEITQPLPSQEDVMGVDADLDRPRSPFPFVAKQMLAYGHLISILNSGRSKVEESEEVIQRARTRAIQQYNALPSDMQWNVTNLQQHSRAHQASAYLHLHLWMHTIIASGYLTDTDYLPRKPGNHSIASGWRSGVATPNAIAASNLWRNSARTIGDILVLSDIITPTSYLSLPFCNQAFYVSGCCFIKEIEQDHGEIDRSGAHPSAALPPPVDTSRENVAGEKQVGKPSELFKSFAASVAANNISTMQQGLSKQTKYWSGIEWIAQALSQRMGGTGAEDIDLASVTEKPTPSISVPDGGTIPFISNDEFDGGPHFA